MGIVAMPGDMVFHHNASEPLKEIDTRGESMNNWEFIKVVDCKSYSAFYSEENGLIYTRSDYIAWFDLVFVFLGILSLFSSS